MNPVLAAILAAHLHVGAGVSQGVTIGDGVWYQEGAPASAVHDRTPVVQIGVDGPVWSRGAFDVRYGLDYVFIGQQHASCSCVPDAQYDAHTHQMIDVPKDQRYSPFDGFGHVQGVTATLNLGYTHDGVRFGLEGGPAVVWTTWHESLYDLYGNWDDLSHKTRAQVSWVVGASVSDGPWSVAYRYYNLPQQWNPYPGLLRGVHTLTLNYRF